MGLRRAFSHKTSVAANVDVDVYDGLFLYVILFAMF